MRNIKINVYKFEELDEDVRDMLIEKYRGIIRDFNFDFLDEDLSEILEGYGLDGCDVHYSLNHVQGDGLSFNHPNLLDSSLIMNKVMNKLSDNEFIELLGFLDDGLKIKSLNKNRSYCFSSDGDIEIDYDPYQYYNLKEDQNKLLEKVRDIVVDSYLDICLELEKKGYACYDVDDDDVIEYIEENGYEFYENGEEYHG